MIRLKAALWPLLILTMLSPLQAVDFSGKLNLFSSLYLLGENEGGFLRHRAGEFATRRLEAMLGIGSRISPKLSWHLRLDVFAGTATRIDGGLFSESTPLAAPRGAESLDFALYEAFFKAEDFLVSRLDLTVGKQRIFWGTADKIGVLDNLNPLDLAQFFTFSPEHFFARRPQTALNFEYYFSGRSKLQLVLLAQKQLSPLPAGFNAMVLDLSPGFRNLRVFKNWAGESLSTLNWGLRLTGVLFNLDWGLSWYRGNHQLAYPVKLKPLTGEMVFLYSGQQVLGLDLAGDVSGIGFWAEAGLFLPQAVEAAISYAILLEGRPVEVDLRGDLFRPAYLKWVLGADYHFPAGFYFNLQYLRGFFDEAGFSDFARENLGRDRGVFFGDLSDYLLVSLEKKFFSEKLKARLAAIGEFQPSGTCVLLPEVEFRPRDNFSLQAGLFAPLGSKSEASRFRAMKNNSMAYLMFKLDF